MISIIIPAYNEEKNIGKLTAYLKENTASDKAEIIVVDGGSKDQTTAEAESAGAKVLNSPKKGRAGQMNFGAKHAKGDVFYFLHSDTRPPKTFVNDISRELNEGSQCGCFRLKFDQDHKILNFYSWFTRFDIDLFRFGDQSLFVKRELFEKTGGFDEKLMVMEDQEIVSRLKDHAQFSIISKPVTTSARKYQKIGVFQLQMIFSIIVCLFYLKISQETIVHYYRAVIDSQPG
ncbi:MAG: TIGR04283 family arsenosugar biosynthesis glycosyltransferase [Gracilimonas sp.]|uniref:TIGR04283 family arsenosugar biosynthesis glycosyltransferase n=1 Tax=Gracilimonas sp. TaxID=1974203 RepID=UPI0037516DF3|nr:TIGR04283 family arsenosugar biosynthesis glycosyltransferase [Gracilimonas sp.]